MRLYRNKTNYWCVYQLISVATCLSLFIDGMDNHSSDRWLGLRQCSCVLLRLRCCCGCGAADQHEDVWILVA